MKSYAFGGGEYRVVVAAGRAPRERALSLVYGVYLAAGLAEPRPGRMEISLHDALPGTVSFLVERLAGESPAAVASLTLVPDSPLGLPLDRIARPALERLRAAGRRPVELAKLATVAATEKRAPRRRAPRDEILLHLFKLAYLAARRLEEATDLVIAVTRHQERYFRRGLLFEELDGAGRGAGLAVPLRLDLEGVEERYRRRYGHRAGERNLYRFFVNEDEPEILEWLRSRRRPLDAEEAEYLLVGKTGLLEKADEAARRFMIETYPRLGKEEPPRG